MIEKVFKIMFLAWGVYLFLISIILFLNMFLGIEIEYNITNQISILFITLILLGSIKFIKFGLDGK